MKATGSIFLALATMFSACDDGDAAEPAPTVAPSEAPAAPGAGAAEPASTVAPSEAPAAPGAGAAQQAEDEEEPDPCALLTEAKVREVFEVPGETPIEHPSSANPVRAVCTYIWDKPNAEELRREIAELQQARVREMMQKMRKGRGVQGMLDMAMDLPRVESRVSLNYAPRTATAADARRMFEAGMRLLEEGITHRVDPGDLDHVENVDERARARVEGQEVTFQADLEPVSGIGDEARWAPRMNQLSILDGNRILYLNVEIDVDRAQNLEHAKRLAAALLD